MRAGSRTLVILALGLFVAALPAAVVAAGANAQMVEVSGRYAFSPASITVMAGSSVTWKNASDASHTVTADGGQFASAVVAAGGTFSQTFSTVGTFAYHCTLHTYMHGTLVVVAAAQSLPPTDATSFGTATIRNEALPLGLLLIGALTLLLAIALSVRHRRSTAGS